MLARPAPTRWRLAAAVLAVGALLAGVPSAAAGPSVAPARAAAVPSGNPLAGHPLAVYEGEQEKAWAPYANATGATKDLLAKIALTPKVKWFGSSVLDSQVQNKVHQYVVDSQGGDPNKLVQLAVFRMVPWEHKACKRLPTPAEQASYRYWIDQLVLGLGDAHAAVVLQPDGPFALCAPHHSKLPSQLIAYTAQRISSLPNASVYIDAGASDWPAKNPKRAVKILMPAGIRYVRGFALNSTHYASLANEVRFGAQISAILARKGVPDKHFVVNTSSNGQPFTFGKARGPGPGDNAKVCETPTERVCVALGVRPTTDVANPAWGLPPAINAQAAAYVDAYLWIGRPWLYMQADPFDMDRALALASNSPW